jgi:hypothetical protein
MDDYKDPTFVSSVLSSEGSYVLRENAYSFTTFITCVLSFFQSKI